ncbi:MAG: hypothetical protein EBR59_02925 [Methylococcaceae bacterium]|mgnify:CR=1 FL=1|jgi:hypothetical protein|nr:hypothetical protein [Methylococcaceae bacterium]
MAVLFFNLRGVPGDEADDIRALLEAHAIDFYETDAGNWGMSLPAIWLYQEQDLQRARPLFDEYQEQRAQRQRALYLQAKRLGEHQNFWQRHRSRPLQFLFYTGALILIAYASVKWVFELGDVLPNRVQESSINEPVK